MATFTIDDGSRIFFKTESDYKIDEVKTIFGDMTNHYPKILRNHTIYNLTSAIIDFMETVEYPKYPLQLLIDGIGTGCYINHTPRLDIFLGMYNKSYILKIVDGEDYIRYFEILSKIETKRECKVIDEINKDADVAIYETKECMKYVSFKIK